MEGLTEGRIVHFVLPDGNHAGEHRAAMIVKVWNATTGYVNLQVFIDGSNDYPQATGPMWATSVEYSDVHEPRTWHWIERA
jgi:hypothetical protein